MTLLKRVKKVLLNRAVLYAGGGIVCGILLASSVIYTTQLKWLNFVEPKIHDVDPKQFWDDYQKDPSRYVFLDVRDKATYDRAHAQAAINEPIANLITDYAVLPKTGKEIVLICSSGRLAGVAYGFLQFEGFTNLRRIEGGTNEWAAEGLPVVGNTVLIPEHD